MAFTKNVFVNCPFDEDFYPLLRPLLFTIIYLRLKPRIALETSDSGEPRLAKIVKLIADSKYAIHDLSRMEARKVGELYRLNMPFELGVDFGCRHFGSYSQKSKKCLVLENEPYRYKAALSDLSGSDIACHHDKPEQIVVEVRNWLKNTCRLKAPGAAKIWGAFMDFMDRNNRDLSGDGWSPADIAALPVQELIERMEASVKKTRLHPLAS